MKIQKQKTLKSPVRISDEDLIELSGYLRHSAFKVCKDANNGHLGGCSGAVELFTVLYFGGILRYNLNDSKDALRDRVLVRGHLGPLRYSIFNILGYLDNSELADYRKLGSRLQGHEDHLLTPGVDITPSGSLGMLLSYGVGSSLVSKIKKEGFRTFVFLGDGEEQEGNISEAARDAVRYNLSNLIVVIDANGKQLSDPCSYTDKTDVVNMWKAYGWNVIELNNGNDVVEVTKAYNKAIKLSEESNIPTMIFAKTTKGLCLPGAKEHFSGFHTTSVCDAETLNQGLVKTSKFTIPDSLHVQMQRYVDEEIVISNQNSFNPDIYIHVPERHEVSLDKAQGQYLDKLRKAYLKDKHPETFFLTADTTRQDFVKALSLKDFLIYENVGLREQHLVAMCHGLSTTSPDSRIIVNSFDAFVYRGIDQLNALQQGGGKVTILGDYSGLTNGRNGSTHQTSGQPAALMAMNNLVFLEPWDTEDLFQCMSWALSSNDSAVYIRIYGGKISSCDSQLPLPYSGKPSFRQVVFTDDPDIVIVSSGVTTGYCIDAAQILSERGVKCSVINVVDHESVNNELFVNLLSDGNPVLTVYNGSSRFLQSNVSSAVMSHSGPKPSSVKGIGFESGTTGHIPELFEYFGLDVNGIVLSVLDSVLR